MADYACVLSEAAYVLAALAEAPTANRYEEFQVLQCIYSEAITSDLVGSLHTGQGGDSAPLAHHLSSMFSSVMAIGAILTPYDSDELPPVAVLGVHSIERLTKALSQALDGRHPDDNIRILCEESLSLEVREGKESGPSPVNLLSAVALADSRMAAFTGQMTTA